MATLTRHYLNHDEGHELTITSCELVITAPEPYGSFIAYRNRCRTTVGVLSELFAKARNRVIITAPFIQQNNGLTKGVLAPAVRSCLKRGVNVGILSTGISLQALDRELLKQLTKGKLRFFQPSANISDENKIGSHAKYCVADGESAYVGSANLTSPGLLGQFELGLLVHGEIAHQIEMFWDYAVETGLFVIVE